MFNTSNKKKGKTNGTLLETRPLISPSIHVQPTPLPEFASERRLLPERIPFRIPLPVHLVGVEPAQIELPKQFGEKHAHFEVGKTV